MNNRNRITILLLQAAPYLLFLAILLVFGSLSDRFLSLANFTNIVIQAAPVAILAIGMTFVLLTAEIDLSVGAVMYLTGCILGLYLGGVDRKSTRLNSSHANISYAVFCLKKK